MEARKLQGHDTDKKTENKASAFCCQSSAGCAVISTEFLRTSGLLCCWSDDVELLRQLNDPVHITCVCTITYKTIFLFRVLRIGAAFGVDTVYKLTLLTYFLRATLCRARLWDCMSSVCPSVHPSVTLRYVFHTFLSTSKKISRPNSL